MRYLKVLGLLGIGLFAVPYAHAQRVVVGFGAGPAYVAPPPTCAYGYYGYAPYACAPYGYYGPEWFSGGVFLGAGPWFHGYYGRPAFRGEFYDRDFHGRRDFDRDRFRGWDSHRGFEGRDFRGHGEGNFRGGYSGGGSGRGFSGGFNHGGGRR